MANIIPELQSRIAGLDDRINRLRAETESAEKERSDLQIALRVYVDLTGATPAPAKAVDADTSGSSSAQRPSSEKKQLIRRLLGAGEATGKSPAQVYKQLVAQNVTDIPITQVRTILWRMADKKQGVETKDGRYWLTAEGGEQTIFRMIG